MRKVDKPHAFDPIKVWVLGRSEPTVEDRCRFAPELKEQILRGEDGDICERFEAHVIHHACVHCWDSTGAEDPSPTLCAMCEKAGRR